MTVSQLRSWRPRRPSAALKRRLLRLAGEPEAPVSRWFWGWLAPPVACARLTLLMFNHGGDGLAQRPAMSFILGDQTSAAYATDGERTEQNHLAAVTFDSTNRSNFRSIIRFTPTTNLSN